MRGSNQKRPTFAVAGMGYIFEKHRQAIEHVDGDIVAVCDVDLTACEKAIGAKKFDHFDDMLTYVRKNEVDYIVICTPNFLHMSMIVKSLNHTKARIICEKPLVLNPDFIPFIDSVRVNCIMQLRYLQLSPYTELPSNSLTHAQLDVYIHRGQWYWDGWKGDRHKSGGLLFNIGVHYFDLIRRLYRYGGVATTFYLDDKMANGQLEFKNGVVNWSIDLTAPEDKQYRTLRIGSDVYDLTKGIETLHKTAYEKILRHEGIRPLDVYDTLKMIQDCKYAYK